METVVDQIYRIRDALPTQEPAFKRDRCGQMKSDEKRNQSAGANIGKVGMRAKRSG